MHHPWRRLCDQADTSKSKLRILLKDLKDGPEGLELTKNNDNLEDTEIN